MYDEEEDEEDEVLVPRCCARGLCGSLTYLSLQENLSLHGIRMSVSQPTHKLPNPEEEKCGKSTTRFLDMGRELNYPIPTSPIFHPSFSLGEILKLLFLFAMAMTNRVQEEFAS